MARSGTGVVRLSAIPLLTWLSATVRTAAASGRGFPSLSKEGTPIFGFRDRN